MTANLDQFTDIFGDEIGNSQPISLPSSNVSDDVCPNFQSIRPVRSSKYTGQHGEYRSIEEIDTRYRSVFSYPYFNLVQSRVIDDALYSDKSLVVCAPTGSGKTVIFEMAIVQLLMEIEEKGIDGDFKIIYMAPVKSLCTERLTEWYPKFTKLGHLCIVVTGDTDVEFQQLTPYRIIITTPEKWNMITRRWPDHRGLVGLIKLFLIDEVHILNDESRGPVLEAVVSRMKTIEASAQAEHRQELLKQEKNLSISDRVVTPAPRIRFVAVSATVSNPEDVTAWLSTPDSRAVFYKFGDECRPVKVRRIVEGYPCGEGTSSFKFDIILSYKLWPLIQKYHDGKPTLIFCNTRKSVTMTAETLSRELTVTFNPEQKAKLTALASTIKNKKLQALVLAGVGCHHAGLLYEERVNIENSFRNRELPILITTTTLAMGVNLPAHLVIIKNTQQYVNGAYQEYSISTILQMVGRAGRPQFDTEATAVIMTTLKDKHRYQALVGGSEPLQSYLHKRIAENLNSEAALGTVGDVAQCVQWLRSTFLYIRAGKDPRRYLQLPHNAPSQLITNKIEELCVKAMNGLASAGLITMDETSCIHSTEAGRLMSIYYIDLNTMKLIMKIDGTESLEKLLNIICDCHELCDMHLRMDERRMLNALNRNNKAATIRFPMKGKITTRQMKLSCVIQAVLGCLQIQDPSLNQEAMKIMRIVDRICKCIVAYVTRPDAVSKNPNTFSAVLNSIILAKCISAHLWENSPYVSKQLKGIGPTFSTLLASAGKTSFMLLEESHPRDLERIMNKGAPAGNILRKQISLLPKYQLTATPSDSTTVTIKLSLLNISFLSENMDNLTAGIRHKCYVVIGDSNNRLLLLTSFQDKDLIDVYDGTISYSIARQSNIEHTIQAYCISTGIVGIDAQCSYTFRELEPLYTSLNDYGASSNQNKDYRGSPRYVQPSVADIYQERKRKNNCDITESKEKKKRDSAIVEKFKKLKESFGVASKKFREDTEKSAKKTDLLLHNFTQKEAKTKSIVPENHDHIMQDAFTDDTELLSIDFSDNFPEDDILMNTNDVERILDKIEKEITTNNSCSDKKFDTFQNASIQREDKTFQNNSFYNTHQMENYLQHASKKNSPYVNQGLEIKKGKKLCNNKSNFSFIDDIEKKNFNDNDSLSPKNTEFSEDIKIFIQNYLDKQVKNQVSENERINQIVVDTITVGDNKTERELEETKRSTINYNNIYNNYLTTTHNNERNINQETHTKPNKIENNIEIETCFSNLQDPLCNYNTNAPIRESPKAEDSKIIKFNSDDDFIILSDDEDEDISNLATQKLLPLSNGSGNESSNKFDNDLVVDCTENTTKSGDAEINNTFSLMPDSSSIIQNECRGILNMPICSRTSNIPLNILSCSLSAKSSQNQNTENSKEQEKTEQKQPKNDFYSSNKFSENPHIRNYSYSRTGIDVLTKVMPDRHICMIKRITVDLNVTEVIKKNEINENQKALQFDLNQEFGNFESQVYPQLIRTSHEQNSSETSKKPKSLSKEKQLLPAEYSKVKLKDTSHTHLLGIEFHKSNINSKEKELAAEKGNFAAVRNEVQGYKVEETNLSYPKLITTKKIKNKFYCPFKSNIDKDIKLTADNTRKQELSTNVHVTTHRPVGIENPSCALNDTKAVMSGSTADINTVSKIQQDVNEDYNRMYSSAIESQAKISDVTEDNDTNNTQINGDSTEKNSIENVLQRYSRLLQSKRSLKQYEILNEGTNAEKNHVTNKDLNNKAKIAYRKYRISDINDNKVPLPNSLTEFIVPKTENYKLLKLNNDPKIYENLNFVKQTQGVTKNHEKQNVSLSLSTSHYDNKSPYPILNSYNVGNTSHNIPLSVHISPVKTEFKTNSSQEIDMDNNDEDNAILGNNDFKFDCSIDDFKLEPLLLNPRTLLQNCEKEESESIIPPPPEFSHYSSYSPEKTDLTTVDFDAELKDEPEKLSRNCNLMNDMDDGNNEDLEFIPDKEIETWTLDPESSDDDENDVPKMNSTLSPSFSIMRNPSAHIMQNFHQSLTQPVVHLNRRVLQEFKFTRRDRLQSSRTKLNIQNKLKKWPHVKRF